MMETVLAHALYLVTIICVLVLGILLDIRWCKNVFRAGSKLVAAIAGGSGFATFSAECGARGHPFFRACRRGIDAIFGRGHCEQAARKEGLL